MQGEGRILVVEDEALIQALAEDLLGELGLGAVAAYTATEALNKLRQQPQSFDAVVIDRGLPDRRGDELLKEIRAFAPSLPIVVASGRALRGANAVPPQDGVALLGKPYTLQQLEDALKAVGVSRRR